MGLLDGRTALVTGAGRGIGAAVAEGLAAEGATVLVSDAGVGVDGVGHDATPAESVAAAINEGGGKAFADATDITDFAACADLIGRAATTLGGLDVVVNAAGILRDGMVFKMSEQDWDAVVAVHLKGTFNITRHAAAWWRENRGGQYRLINFTSMSGLQGAPSQPNYAAAKMGIVGFTYSCANALARYGVTANVVSPGAATRMTGSVPAERRRSVTAPDAERSPDNVAPLVAYLASEESGWINGRIVHARGYEVALYNNPEPVVRVIGTGPWDLDALAEQVERSFGPLLGRQP